MDLVGDPLMSNANDGDVFGGLVDERGRGSALDEIDQFPQNEERHAARANVQNRSPTPGTSSTAVRYKLLGNAVLEYCEFPPALKLIIVVVESMWDRCPDAGPPALTEMKVSCFSSYCMIQKLTTSTLGSAT